MYKSSYQIKIETKQKLKGTYWMLFLIFLIIEAFTLTVSFIPYIGEIMGMAIFIFSGPIIIATALPTLLVARGTKKVEIEWMLDGFKNDLGRNVSLGILQSLYIFLWSLLLFIPGIIKSYAYSQAFYLALENPNLSAREALNQSQDLMYGHKARLFFLDLSFIGWYFLGALAFGVGILFVIPYHQQARAVFYTDLVKIDSTSEAGDFHYTLEDEVDADFY